MYKVYRIITFISYPLIVLLFIYRKILGKEHKTRYKEKLFSSCFDVTRKKENKLIWFHAASIGEMNSIIPIINKLNEKHLNLDFLVTSVTFSSGKIAEEKFKHLKNVNHRYFPVDVRFLISKFLNKWKPNVIFLVDSEIWPNLINLAKKNKIPLALINARLTKKSFNRWMMFETSAREIFSHFKLCLASNEETKNFLNKLNVKNVLSVGNIKLINDINIENIKTINEKVLTKRKFWCASSTHEGEELFCLNVHTELKKKYRDIITIIAPRHIERNNKIKMLCEDLNLNSQILNRNDKISEDKEVIIINSFGSLLEYFKFARSVFVGKSLLKRLQNDSGQSPIDAAKLGCKIYHGPFVYNFKEIYNILKKNKISCQVNTENDLAKELIKDLESEVQLNKSFSNSFNDLGNRTLIDTMNIIDKFLINETH